jgi:hypothetical protein
MQLCRPTAAHCCQKRACAQACNQWTSSWELWLASARPSARGRKSTEGGSPNAPSMGATTLPPLLTCFTARTGRIFRPTLNTSTAPVQQLADKIRAAGHVTAEDVQSCVENFRVDDAMILKVRDIASVARRK